MSRVKASWPSARWTSPPLLPVPMPSRAIRTPVLPSGTMSVARAGDAAMAAGAARAAPMIAADWRMNSRRFRRCSLIRPPVITGSLYGLERLLRGRPLCPRPSVRREQARHRGHDDGAKDDPDEAEGRDPAEQADEHQQAVHLRAPGEQRRAHHVVDRADHAGAYGDENEPLGGGSVHEEPDAGGQPDRPRADRQQREERHGHAPEHRRADADGPEQQAARCALRAGDSNRRHHARPYQIRRASRKRKNIAKTTTTRSNSRTPRLRSRSPAHAAAKPPTFRPRSAAISASVMPAMRGARCCSHIHQRPTRSNSPAATAACTLLAAAPASRTNALSTSITGTMSIAVTTRVLRKAAGPCPYRRSRRACTG